MYKYHFFVVLFTVLMAHHSSGQPIKQRPRRIYIKNGGELLLHPNLVESNRGPDLMQHYDRPLFNNQRHPDHTYNSRDEYSVPNSENQAGSSHYSIFKSTFETLIDGLIEYSAEKNVPVNLKDKDIILKVAKNVLDSRYIFESEPLSRPNNRKQDSNSLDKIEKFPSNDNVAENIHETFEQHQTESLSEQDLVHFNKMIELMNNNGFKVNRDIMERLAIKYKYNSRELLKKILDGMLPDGQLLELSKPSKIPRNIRFAIKDFLENVSQPGMDSHLFMTNIKNYINSSKYRKSQIQAAASKSDSKVELIDGSGIEINEQSLIFILNRWKNDPRLLIGSILSEVVPFEQLINMSASKRPNFSPMPTKLYDTIKAYVEHVTGNKLDENEYIKILQLHFFASRRKWKNMNLIRNTLE